MDKPSSWLSALGQRESDRRDTNCPSWFCSPFINSVSSLASEVRPAANSALKDWPARPYILGRCWPADLSEPPPTPTRSPMQSHTAQSEFSPEHGCLDLSSPGAQTCGEDRPVALLWAALTEPKRCGRQWPASTNVSALAELGALPSFLLLPSCLLWAHSRVQLSPIGSFITLSSRIKYSGSLLPGHLQGLRYLHIWPSKPLPWGSFDHFILPSPPPLNNRLGLSSRCVPRANHSTTHRASHLFYTHLLSFY